MKKFIENKYYIKGMFSTNNKKVAIKDSTTESIKSISSDDLETFNLDIKYCDCSRKEIQLTSE